MWYFGYVCGVIVFSSLYYGWLECKLVMFEKLGGFEVRV